MHFTFYKEREFVEKYVGSVLTYCAAVHLKRLHKLWFIYAFLFSS